MTYTVSPLACPQCNDPIIVELPSDWQRQVDRGANVEIVGCGNPWHYRGLDPDPLTAEISTTVDIDGDLGHDGGLLNALFMFALGGAGAGGLIVLAIAWLLWGRS